MKVIVVQNSTSDLGELGGSLAIRYGAKFDVVRPQEMSLNIISPGDADLFIMLGSPQSVYDNHVQWIREEIELARRLIEFERPLVGVCFGAQVIAAAVGGHVAPSGRFYTGWLTNEEAINAVWGGEWFRWHGDAIELPDGVDVLARSGSTIQAFRKRRAIGIQFHPEVTEDLLRIWIEADRKILERLGHDVEKLLDAGRLGLPSGRHRVDALTDEIMLTLDLNAFRSS